MWSCLGSNVQHGVVERSIVVEIDGYHSAGKLHRVCRVRDCSVVIVRHLSSVEREASSKHSCRFHCLLILDVGANAGLNKDEVLLAIGSVSS